MGIELGCKPVLSVAEIYLYREKPNSPQPCWLSVTRREESLANVGLGDPSRQQTIEDTMTLQEYFSTEPLGARGEMAEYLGISLTWLSLLIHERRTASAALAVKIEKATQGLVTRKDLRPDLFFV
jgi:hypothetical protein